jgi:hypothetical protein
MMVDQFPDAPVALFRGGLALVIPMFDLLMFEVGVQGPKIRHGQSRPRGGRRCLARRPGRRGVVLVTKAAVNRGHDIRQQPVLLLGACSRTLLFRVVSAESVKQVGAADNSDHSTVAYHRNAFDPIFLQEPGDFRCLGCFGYPDHRRGHDISSGELRVAENSPETPD